MGLDSYSPLAREVYVRDKFICQYCGRNGLASLDDYCTIEIDHIIPKHKGGSDNPENLVVACRTCNSYKQSFDKTYDFSKGPKEIESLINLAREAILKRRDKEKAIFLQVKQEIKI